MNTEIPQNEIRKDGFFKEIIKFTIIALVIIVPIRTYIAQPFIVSGASMDPAFSTGQYLVVDQLSYHLSDPKREDVIIFKYPRDTSVFFIKRIIGLPGETVVSEGGKITITNKSDPDGFQLSDKYIKSDHKTTENFKITLDDTEYFVMGDNRSESSDSRTWGPLEARYILGRPILRLLPFSKLSIFPGKIDYDKK